MGDVKLIGITGGVGSGKSSLLHYIENTYNCEMYLTDIVAKDVRQKGTDSFNRMIEILGEDILDEKGDINNKIVAGKIFGSNDLKNKVNDLIHPKVIDFLLCKYEKAKMDGKVDFMFIESALIENLGKLREYMDEVWYIYAEKKVRIERLKENRGYDEVKIERIIASQLSDYEFRKISDFIIDNSNSIEESYKQIDARVNSLLCENRKSEENVQEEILKLFQVTC